MAKRTIQVALIVGELEDVSDEEDGSVFLGTVEILGASHHLEIFQVASNEHGEQYAVNADRDEVYEDLQHLYSGGYATFSLPGFEGEYIAYMHPFVV